MNDVAAIRIAPAWKELLSEEFLKPYFIALTKKVRAEYLAGPVYPPPKDLFRAFDLCSPEEVKVVILGQDPYHTKGVAHGLAFSTNENNQIPPSLLNIFKEVEQEYGQPINRNPDLTRWAKQGVLLLNASLTVRAGAANSHADYGWHQFTDAVIRALSEKYEHIVFMLWGSFASKKASEIDFLKHKVLTSAHPSPLSAHKGFLGNGHFKAANEYLKENGRGEMTWIA